MARVDAPMTEHACTHWPCPICDADLIALSTDDQGVVRMPTAWWAGETGCFDDLAEPFDAEPFDDLAEPRVTRHEPEDNNQHDGEDR